MRGSSVSARWLAEHAVAADRFARQIVAFLKSSCAARLRRLMGKALAGLQRSLSESLAIFRSSENGLTPPYQPRILIPALSLWRMTMEDLLQRITVNPNMAFGKPTIRGLRYSVEWLLELLSSGMSQQEILEDYEDLEPADIQAVLAYAAKLAQIKRVMAVAG
jgi:uncharacterized protein (DUF433 family)